MILFLSYNWNNNYGWLDHIFRKILVPYDGSKQAENALNKAVYLANLISGSELVILNVLDEIKSPSVMFDKKVRNYKTGKATRL